MILTKEERQLLDGDRGPALQKAMKVLLRYAQTLDANQFVDLEGQGHFAIPAVTPGLGPPKLLDDMISKGRLGVKSGRGFYGYPDPNYRNPDCQRYEPQNRNIEPGLGNAGSFFAAQPILAPEGSKPK